MEVTIETLSTLVKSMFGDKAAFVKSDSVGYLVSVDDYGVMVELVPVTIEGQSGPIYSIEIRQTFCYTDGQPVNLKSNLDGERSDLLNYFHDMSVWGRIDFIEIDLTTTAMVLSRHEVMSEFGLEEEIENIETSKFVFCLSNMVQEWCAMKDLLILLTDCPGSDAEINDKVDLLLFPTQGHC